MLLWISPRRFREAFAGEMAEVYADRLREVSAGGRRAMWRFWRRTAWNVAWSGMAERFGMTPKPNVPLSPRRPPRRPADNLWLDLRGAVRSLRRAPGFAAAAVAMLALGVGANTTMFGLVNAVLLRPLPYPDSDRLMYLIQSYRVSETTSVSFPNYVDWRDQNDVFVDMTAAMSTGVTLTGSGEAAALSAAATSASFFATLRVAPAIGRGFTETDDRPGAAPVGVISHRLWRDRLGSDASVVGRTLVLDGQPTVIVGVAPPTLDFPSSGTDVWIPIQPVLGDELHNRGSHPGTVVIGRLRRGVSEAEARADMARVSDNLAVAHPETNAERGAFMRSLRDSRVGDTRGVFLLLFAAVGLVLVIACANVANLLLARSAGREREMAVRSALGAGRGRLAAQLLTESLVLGALGGVAGWLVAMVTNAWVVSVLGVRLRALGLETVPIDWRVMGFAMGVSLFTGVVFGLVPAVAAGATRAGNALSERSSAGGHSRVRSALIVGEIALSVVLLTGATLMLRSFANATRSDPGFVVDGLVSVRVSPVGPRYADQASRVRFFDEAVRRTVAVPGVESAAVVHPLPLVGWGSQWGVSFDDSPVTPSDERIRSDYARVSFGYFETMGIPLVTGRVFAEGDVATATPVAVIDETMARTHFPGVNPVGRTFRVGSRTREIVGVVGHVKNYGVNAETRVQFYVPVTQWNTGALTVVARVGGDEEAFLEPVRRAVGGVDPTQPVYMVSTVGAYFDNNISGERIVTWLLAVFAAMAVVMAMLGIYGVIAYHVSRRTREIGLRMALGARGTTVVGQVVGRGLRLTAIGVVLGVVGALAATRVLESLLFGVGATDPTILFGVGLGLGGAAMMASWIPAARASRVDPVEALRAD